MTREFRLRCKVLEHEGQTYLIALGLAAGPDRITAFGMSDENTVIVDMSIEAWNSLKWHWFASEGETERREHKPVKAVPLGVWPKS